jgi:hypothetical protein
VLHTNLLDRNLLEHNLTRYTDPQGSGPRGLFIPGVSSDMLTQIFYDFYNMCEPDDIQVPVRVVLQDLKKRYKSAQVWHRQTPDV